MTSLIASWVAERPRGSLATSTSSTWAGSSSRSSRGASRSATTTSAEASACRAATVASSGSPGPPPTRTTPAVVSRVVRAVRVPSRSAVMISSRTPADLRGSRLASTATVSPPWRPTAGVQAVPPAASSARTQKIRRRSHSSETRALVSGSSVAATTYHASSRSASSKRRSTQVISPASPSRAGVTSGETSRTSAPAPMRAGTRRWATWPPPTTTTRRPARRSPTGYGGASVWSPSMPPSSRGRTDPIALPGWWSTCRHRTRFAL